MSCDPPPNGTGENWIVPSIAFTGERRSIAIPLVLPNVPAIPSATWPSGFVVAKAQSAVASMSASTAGPNEGASPAHASCAPPLPPPAAPVGPPPAPPPPPGPPVADARPSGPLGGGDAGANPAPEHAPTTMTPVSDSTTARAVRPLPVYVVIAPPVRPLRKAIHAGRRDAKQRAVRDVVSCVAQRHARRRLRHRPRDEGEVSRSAGRQSE